MPTPEPMPVPVPPMREDSLPPAAPPAPAAVPVPPQFERYLTPEFTRQLFEHLYEAKKRALQDAADEERNGRA